MKRLFLFILFIFILYTAKPYWEEPVSHYVDISFLEPVDEKIDALLTSESLNTAILTITDTVDKAVLFFNFKIGDR